jgi:TatD DNase family protein
MIDSHCHLADKAFDPDRGTVIVRARNAGVSAMVTIADSLEEAEKCRALAEKHERIFFTAGVHPHNAKEWQPGDAERLKDLLRHPKALAVGEIGLDEHYGFSPREAQRAVFREQLLVAKELGLPSVVHCREAIADVRSIIEEVDAGPFVLHCCTEKWKDVEWILDRGSLLSFTGIATFPKSEDIRETVRNCPLESMMVETDAPYLAPIPHRGKRCEPAFVVDTARFLAAEKGMSLEQFDPVVSRTTTAFFGLPS